MSIWSVELCQNWVRIGQIQNEAFEFHGIERFNAIGEWECSFPQESVSWSYYIDPVLGDVPYSPRDVNTIRLVENRTIRYPGYVRESSPGSGGALRTLDDTGLRWKLSGPDLWDVLTTRLAYPDPSLAQSWAVSHDVNTGVASTVLAAYLNDNAGSSALGARQISGFSVADNGVGPSGTWSARLVTLYDLALRICADGDMTIRWSTNFAGQVIATITAPRDLSDIKVLSDQADLTRVDSKLIPARSTYVIAGGDGTGASRTFRSADTGALGANRRERFLDQGSLTQTSELQSAATTATRLDAAQWAITGEVAESVTDAIGFGRFVFVGDKVAIYSGHVRYVVPVNEIGWHITAERQQVEAVLGEAIPDSLRGLLDRLDDIHSRVTTDVA